MQPPEISVYCLFYRRSRACLLLARNQHSGQLMGSPGQMNTGTGILCCVKEVQDSASLKWVTSGAPCSWMESKSQELMKHLNRDNRHAKQHFKKCSRLVAQLRKELQAKQELQLVF